MFGGILLHDYLVGCLILPEAYRMSGYKHNFDSFTVLQDVARTSLKGHVFEASEVDGGLHNILIGFDKEEGMADISLIGQESNSDASPVLSHSEAFAYTVSPSHFVEISQGTHSAAPSDPSSLYGVHDLDAVFQSATHFQTDYAQGLEDHTPNIRPTLREGALAGVHDEPDSAQIPPQDSLFIPQADTPTLSIESAHGAEDSPIELTIQASLNDKDGQETLHIQISNVPEGGILSAGQDQGHGTWIVFPQELEGLTLSMPEHYSGEFTLSVIAVSTEITGETATHTVPLPVVIDPVVDTPHLSVTSAMGLEDTAIALDIKAFLVDQDGSETLSLVTISNVPEGAILSAGTQNPDGSYDLTLSELEHLTLTPPLHSNEDFTLSLSVNSTESDGQSLTVTAPLSVHVTGVADAPVARADFGGVRSIGQGKITAENARATDQGFQVLARNVNEDGSLTDARSDYVGVQGRQGFGAGGDTDNAWIDAETGYDPNAEASEELILQFDDLVVNAKAEFSYFFKDWTGGIENGTVTAYREGHEVGHIDFIAPQDRTLNINFMDQAFDELVFKAHPYANVEEINPRYIPMDSSDFLMKSFSYTKVTEIPSDTIMAQEDMPLEIGQGLSGELVDSDGSEVLGYVIENIPEGAHLSAGLKNHDGTYSLTEDELDNLIFTPPHNFSGTIPLVFTVIASENDGDQAFDSVEFTIQIEALADVPILDIQTVTGLEDQAIDLDISSALTDTDGSESLSLILSDIPHGAILSAGTMIQEGTYHLSGEDLDGLQIIAPPNSNEDFILRIEAIATEDNGDTAHSIGTQNVVIKGVADHPDVYAHDAIGLEDQAIDMDFGGALHDLDGSERLYFDVRNIPEGASFTTGRAIARGKHWRFNTESQAEEAQLIPPENFSGELDLTFRAYARENDGNRSFSETEFKVSVSGVADAPRSFSVREARGLEDHEIKLDIRHQLADQDGSESFSIVISNHPEGTVFSHGSESADGSWIVLQEDIANLTLTPPLDSNEDFTLSVTGVVIESDGDLFVFDTSLDLPVFVRGVADMPTLDLSDRVGYEDTALDLELGAFLTDLDGSENLSVLISNIPEGVALSPAGTYVSAGTYSYTAEEAERLTLVPPKDFSGELLLDVRAIAQENDGDRTVFNTQLSIDIDAIADAPHISGGGIGAEDRALSLDIHLQTTDGDGSEMMSDTILIENIPQGAELSAGIDNGNGSYSLNVTQLEDLRITPPLHSNEDFMLKVTATSVDVNGDESTITQALSVNVTGIADAPNLTVSDAHAYGGEEISLDIQGSLVDTDGSETLYYILSDVPEIYQVTGGIYGGSERWIVQADDIANVGLNPLTYDPAGFQIQVTAVTVENDGDIAHTQLPLTIDIVDSGGTGGLPHHVGQSAAPSFSRSLGDSTQEDTQIDVDGTVYYNHGGALSFLITDIPEGVEPNLGFYDLEGGLIVPLEQIGDLRFEPVEDFSGDLQMTYTAIQIQAGRLPNSATKTADIHLDAVADSPLITLSPVSGAEDSVIAIPIDVSVTDQDGSEFITHSVTIENVPEDASLSAGLDSGDGVWIVPVSALAGLSFIPPLHAHGTYELSVTATSEEISNQDQAHSTQKLSVTVDAVADHAILEVSAGAGMEDQWLDVSINAQFVDVDGSEMMSIIISNLPEEARLSAGLNNGDGSWTLQPSQLEGLQIHAPDDFSGSIEAQITMNTIEGNGSVAVVSQGLPLYFEGVSDGVTLDATPHYTGQEDQGIPIILQAEALDRDGSETLEVIFSNFPDGSSFSVGAAISDGQWLITGLDVNHAVFYPPDDFSGEIELNVRVDALEDVLGDSDGDRSGLEITQTLSIAPVADTPDIEIGTHTYDSISGQSIVLDISAQLGDQDGSESLSMHISDVPDEVSFSEGENQGQGVWLFEDISVEALEMHTQENFTGDFALTVQASATEMANGDMSASEEFELFFLLNPPPPLIGTQEGGYGDPVSDSGDSPSWLESVEQDQDHSDPQETDALGDVIDTPYTDVSGADSLHDQSGDGLFS